MLSVLVYVYIVYTVYTQKGHNSDEDGAAIRYDKGNGNVMSMRTMRGLYAM